MKPPFDRQNESIRTLLRVGAAILLPVGGIFTLIGMVDFFRAFGSMGQPKLFWCAFVGLPLVAAGMFCFKAGFLGKITAYVAGESAPALRKTVHYVADGLKDRLDGGDQPEEERPGVRLERLENLHRKGLISENEYATKRSEILQEL